MNLWKWFTTRPLWLQIAIIVLILIILYSIYKWIKRKTESGNYYAAVSQSETALNQLAQQGIHPSYPQDQYTSMANALETTFTGCGLDWAGVVKPTFEKMKNDADIHALIKNYSVREFDECVWGTFNGDLSAALTYKTGGIILTIPNVTEIFTDASVSAINKILKQNGLTFQF